MLFSVVRLEILWRNRPVSTKIEPPGRVGLLRLCHASEKNACRSKLRSNSSDKSTRISSNILRIIRFMSLVAIVEIKKQLYVLRDFILRLTRGVQYIVEGAFGYTINGIYVSTPDFPVREPFFCVLIVYPIYVCHSLLITHSTPLGHWLVLIRDYYFWGGMVVCLKSF